MDSQVGWWKNVYSPPLKHRSRDHTYFTLFNLSDGFKTYEGEKNCFMTFLEQLDQYTWIVRQSNGESDPLSKDDYFRWVDLCKQNKIMPPNAVPDITEGGLLRISLSGKYHQVFAGLNCFRWAANQKDMPKFVMDLLEFHPSLNFYQAFHFSLKKYNYWYNHSFSDSIRPGSVRHKETAKAYLITSLGMQWFFREYDKPDSSFKPSRKPTAASINAYLADIGFERDNEEIDVWNKDATNVLHLPLNKAEDILWDDWKYLYEMTSPTKEKVMDYYTEVIKKHS